MAILFLLPFQKFPRTIMGYGDGAKAESLLLKLISYTDEMSFIVFGFFTLTFILMKPSIYYINKIRLSYWLLAFIIYGIIISVVKSIPFAQAGFGIFDPIKNILILFVFASLKFKREELLYCLRVLINICFIIAIIGIIGEILALSLKIGIDILVINEQRFGLYRVISLTGMGNHNYVGIYATLMLFLCIALEEYNVINKIKIISFIALIGLTLSRQAWLSFAIMLPVLNPWMLLIALGPFIGVVSLLYFRVGVSINPEKYFRLFAFIQSIEILKKDPLTGIGPGRFGSLASILWESPVYDKWPQVFREYAYGMRGIDQFWPCIWGEFGILGFLIYLGGLISLFNLLRKASNDLREQDRIMSRIGKILQYFLVSLFIMGTAGGLGAAFVSYTYFALVGIFISLYKKQWEEVPQE